MPRTVALLLTSVLAAAALPAQESALGAVPLLPGDLLRVSVWREPDLSGEFLVDRNGSVVLPLLGELTIPGTAFSDVRGDSLMTNTADS
jgi:protein involved in polysaccharide export with SLBB domain